KTLGESLEHLRQSPQNYPKSTRCPSPFRIPPPSHKISPPTHSTLNPQLSTLPMGLFDRLKQGLKKTTQLLKTDVRDLFKAEGRLIDQPFLDEMRAILFKTDMG